MSSKKSIRWSSIAAALFFALIVNSRGSLVAIVVFLAAYNAAYKGSFRFLVYGLITLSAVVCLALVWPQLSSYLVEDVLHLHHEKRGLGSGMTGRWELLKRGIDSFWQRPVFGWGFRASGFGEATSLGGTQATGSHSGLLKLFIETGFVGGFLMLGAIALETLRRFRIAQLFSNAPAWAAPGIDVVETTRINVIAFAMLCTTLTIWLYEPLYVNLGSVSSLLFWLMMVAPVYITAQGAPIQR